MVRAGADFSALKKETEKARQTLESFQATTKNIFRGIATTLLTLGIGKIITDSVKSATQFQASLQQINRTLGVNAIAFQKWANDQAVAFNLSKSEAIKYGAVFSNLVSGFAKDTSETLKYTEDLLKASSVIASATGRSMEDVMERIRSGLLGNTEAIEDLGVNVNIAMLQTTEAFRRFAGDKSWQQLDFQTQQQIRLMAILEQTSKKYGGTIFNNAASAQAQFIAQLKNLQLALGQAFLPIYQTILPALTAFIARITQAFNIVAQFMQVLFGKKSETKAQINNTVAQASAVENLGNSLVKTGKAAKRTQGILAGFDELNILSSKSQNEGSSGGGGETGAITPIPAPDTGGIIDSINNVSGKVTEYATKIREFFSNLASGIQENKDIITSAIAGIITAFAAFKIISNWQTIVNAFQSALGLLTAALGGISAPALAVAAAIGAVVAGINYLWQTNEGFRAAIISAWESIKATFASFQPAISALMASFMNLWNSVLSPLLNFLAKVFLATISVVIPNAIRIISSLLTNAAPVFKGIMTLLNGIITFLTGVFTLNWRKAWDGVVKVFKGIFGAIVSAAKFPINQLIDAINLVIHGINKLSIKIPDWVPGFGGKTWGIHIPTIPKLAQGGYIGANNPMLAIIGDNRYEGEIVAPESKIYEQAYNAIKDALGNTRTPIELTINLGGATIFKEIINGINMVQRQAGKTLVTI